MLCRVELQRIVLFRLVGRLNLNAGTAGTLLDVDNIVGVARCGHSAFDHRVVLVSKLVALDIRRCYAEISTQCNTCFIAICHGVALFVDVVNRQGVVAAAPGCPQCVVLSSLYNGCFRDLVSTQIPALKGMMGAGRSRQVAVRSIKGDFLARLADRSVVRVGVEGHGVGVRFPLGS